MTKRLHIYLIALFSLFASAAWADPGTYTFTLGGTAGWTHLRSAEALTTAPGRLGRVALVLDSSAPPASATGAGTVDLLLTFDGGSFATAASDETGNYRVAGNGLRPVGASEAYRGAGAASATAGQTGLSLSGKTGSLFGGETATGSFTIEFWMRPASAENGSELFSWQSSITEGGASRFQYARAHVAGNRMLWSFSNVWSKNGAGLPDVTLRGASALIPGAWSHHAVSYDADRGALSYRMNGKLEAIRYLTDDGTERGTVYPSRFGRAARIEIGSNYAGLLDEFAIVRACADPESPEDYRKILDRYGARSGRFVSEPVDTGGAKSRLISFSVDELTPGDSGTAYFVRVADEMWNWTENDPAWIPVAPGKGVVAPEGRFFQVAGELYPAGDGAKSPTVTEVSVTYERDSPAWPPTKVYAEPGDSAVKLSWKPSPDADTVGYLVYYGDRPGEYLAEGSPVNVGDSLTATIGGLKNGRAYYFCVAAYDRAGSSSPGPLSAEVGARPRVAPVTASPSGANQ